MSHDPGGERTALEVSQNLAPFAGLGGTTTTIPPFKVIAGPVEDFVTHLVNGSLHTSLGAEHLLNAPGIRTSKDIFDTVSKVYTTLGAIDLPEDSAPKMQIAVQQALDLIPIYGNAYAANLFSESGLIMNKYGDPVIEATHNEKIAKAFIGLRSKEHSQVTDFITDLKGRELRS